jgi:S-adenosylmethionine synthetase
MPLSLVLSHVLLIEMAKIRREGKEMTYLAPDSKSQVTIEYGDDNEPMRVHTIVVSTQHDDFDEEQAMLAKIKSDVQNILIPRAKHNSLKEFRNYSKTTIYSMLTQRVNL